MAVFLAIALKFFGSVCRGNPLEILTLVAVYVACVAAFGLMMDALVREPYHAITWSLFYVMPSVLFYVIPIGYAANDLRSLFVKGSAAGMEWHMAATAYSLLIGNLYRGGIVQRIPVAICDLDDSPVSRELIRAVADADQYDFRQSVSDDAEAVNLLERGEVAAVLIIPEDFSGKFYRAESVSVAFLQDAVTPCKQVTRPRPFS